MKYSISCCFIATILLSALLFSCENNVVNHNNVIISDDTTNCRNGNQNTTRGSKPNPTYIEDRTNLPAYIYYEMSPTLPEKPGSKQVFNNEYPTKAYNGSQNTNLTFALRNLYGVDISRPTDTVKIAFKTRNNVIIKKQLNQNFVFDITCLLKVHETQNFFVWICNKNGSIISNEHIYQITRTP